MTVVDPPVPSHSDGECHHNGHTGTADHVETLVPAGTGDVGHDGSSDSRHLLNTLTSGQASSQTYRHPLPDLFFQPHYHPTRESYSGILRDNDGRYSGAQVQLALPDEEGSPIYVSIPHLRIQGFAYRIRDGRRPRQKSQSVTQADDSPVEQENGQTTEVDDHLGHAGGADEGGGLVRAMMARLLNIIWPLHMG